MRTILITGGAGFVGANLAVYFAQKGDKVIALDNLVRRGSEYNVQRLKKWDVEFIHGDVRCPEDWPRVSACADRWAVADIILDTAAQPSAIDAYQNPMFDFTNNLGSVFQMLDYVQHTKTPIIFWSSNKVYPQWAVHKRNFLDEEDAIIAVDSVREDTALDGHDRSIYGATKLAAELIIKEFCASFGIPVICNRFSCLAGEWQWGKTEQGWVAWWVIANHFKKRLNYIGWDGRQTRDVLWIDDVAVLIERQIDYLLANKDAKPLTFNVGGGRGSELSPRQLTKLVESKTGIESRFGPLVQERRADFMAYTSNIEKVCKMFDWEPTKTNEEGVEDLCTWVAIHHKEIAEVIGC
jgi:CDP-paratose 2-epimerase